MPHIKLPNFRLGILPSVRSSYKMDNLTPSQKLDLVAARIFGISFGGNLRNGMKAIKRLDSGQNRARQSSVPVWNPAQWFPFMTQWRKLEFNRKLVDGRKMRIMMRGVKIGRQKGGEKISINIFIKINKNQHYQLEMIQFIILIIFLFFTNTIARIQCTCNQIKNSFECMFNQDCQWKFNNCETKNCGELYSPSQCLMNKKCYYNAMNQSCLELTDCSILNGTSNQECNSQSLLCGFYNSTLKQCQSLNRKDCNLYTIESECQYYGQGQLCLWINQKCQFLNCPQLVSQNECHIFQVYCSWDFDNLKCIPATCSNKPISECSVILLRDNNEINFQPCQVDYSEGLAKCKNAALSDLTVVTCGLNTLNFATWSENNFDNYRCQLCDANIIKILILALLIMIQ